MAYLEVSAFKKLRAFFWALQKSSFNLNKIPTRDNEGTPVDKTYCLNLLRSFPDFQGEAFKDDNFLIKYLSKPGNLKQILDQFTPAQQIELTKVLEEKPPAAGVAGEQPGGGETSAEQGVPAQTPVGTATGTMGVPSLPSGTSISSRPRGVIRIVQQTKPPGAESTTANVPGLKNTPETGLDYEGKPYKMDAEHVPPKEKAGGRRFQAPKLPYQVTNAAKNFGSAAQRFIGTNLGRIGRGLGEIAKGVGRGIAGPMLNGAYKGLGKVGGGGLNAFERLSNPGLRGASRSFVSSGSKKLAWGIFGAFFFFVLGAGLIGSLSGTTPSGQAAPVGPVGITGIANCTFYRGGDPVQGLKITNPALASLITEISNKVGVPPAIIAGIMRVETASAIVSTSDYLTNDYDAHSSGVAYGIMQFTPSTFESTFLSNKTEMQSLFGKTEVKTTLDPQDNLAPANVLRIYSIKDSITAATFKVRGDKKSISGDGPWDENTIKEVAKRYYGTNADGTTNYPGWDGSTQNYGDDLWKSYTNCQAPTVSILASCPIQNPIISCGSLSSGHPSCEHANPKKGYPSRSSYLPSTANGIDVVGADPLNSDQHLVYLPSINNQPTEWEFRGEESIPNYNICQPPATCSGHEWGFSRAFNSKVGIDVWEVHLKHVNTGDPAMTLGQKYSSGTLVGRLYPDLDGPGRGHNHINILKNGAYIRPDIDLKMCNPTYL